MAKKMRRTLALMLALALCAGQVAVPAMAAETPAPVTNTVTNTIDNGTEKITTITDLSTGTKITITETNTTSESDNGGTTTSTQTDTIEEKMDGTGRTENSEWKSEEILTGGPTTTMEGNPTEVVETNVTTTIEGNENSEQTVTNMGGGIEKVSGSLEGEETTDIVDTTVTTTTETGKTITTENPEGSSNTESIQGTDTTTGEWVEGEATDNDWVEGETKKGTAGKGTTKTNSTETIDPEYDKNVTLDLTPGGGEVTKKYTVSLEDVAKLPKGDGYTITELKDAKGNLIGWEVTYDSTESSKLTGSETTDKGTWTETGTTTKVVKPTLRAEEDTDDSDGVTTRIEEILDEDGNFLGYKVIKTTVTSTDKITTETSERENIEVDGAEETVGFTLPEKPEESETTNQFGETTKTTVTDLLDADGNHVGYTTTIVTTNLDGDVMYTETQNIYGTTSTEEVDIVKDPETEETTTTTKVTTVEIEEIYATESERTMEKNQTKVDTYETTILTDKDTYELIETEDGMFFLYKGEMYAVQAIDSHGDTTLNPIKPDKNLITAKKGSDLRNKNGTSNGLFSSLDYNSGNTDYEFRYVGNGLASTLRVSYSGGNTTAHQFALKDSSGNIHYVYCCDLDTSARTGYRYNMVNLDDASYYKGDKALEHIRAIALNGYWGTESGDGSLDAVKQLLKESGYKNWNTLTEGQAVAATQAALWQFGHRNSSTKLDSTIVQYDVNWNSIGKNAADSANVQALFNLLISNDLMNKTEYNETDLITKEDITGAAITIKGEAKNADGTTKTDSNGNTKYNTDLSFTLKVDKSSITGNLKISVYVDGEDKPIATEWLAKTEGGILSYGIEADQNGTYTIEGLEIAEGVNVTLKLDGTQDLEKGVYLYTSETIGGTGSQTFVGLAEGERDVNLEVNLKFSVEDPEIEHTNSTTTQKRTDTVEATKTDTRTDSKHTDRLVTGGHVQTDVSHRVEVTGTITTTTTNKKVTKEDRHWESYYEYLLELVNDEDGGEEDGGEEIWDEEVPLADAPRTGDISGIWAAISLLSLGGAALLGKKREDEE